MYNSLSLKANNKQFIMRYVCFIEERSPLNCSAPSTIEDGGVYVYILPTNVKVSMVMHKHLLMCS